MNKYTVTELTRAVKGLLENTFSDNISVKGEISSFSRSPAGHLYFVLKDEKAQIKCVMFRGMADANRGYAPKNGDSVEAAGSLTVYEAGGNYQLLVKKLDYDSVGLFWQLFEQVKTKLEAEGLFDQSRKKATPYLPVKVAVVTSPEGAAIKDFLITMRNSDIRFSVDIWAVPVQGKDAVAPIVAALSKAGAMTDRYDALVLMRGGGSLEDLAVFNEEYVARALAGCSVPTISAIGHERDISICDFAADVRVATPTAAAVYLGEGYKNSGRDLDIFEKRLANIMNRSVMTANQRLDLLMNSVYGASPKKMIESDIRKLDYLMRSVAVQVKNKLGQKRSLVSELTGIMNRLSPSAMLKLKISRVGELERRVRDLTAQKNRTVSDRLALLSRRVLEHKPDRKAEAFRNRLDKLEYRLANAVKSEINVRKSRLAPLNAKLETLDPKNILAKGYSFVMLNGRPVKSVFDVTLQDELEIRLNDGYINSFVTGKKVSEENDG
jgi:exodeoxyribonuclease VII large subunit